MSTETANKILRATDEMTGVEIALLTIIKDLQVRVAQLTLRLDGEHKTEVRS